MIKHDEFCRTHGAVLLTQVSEHGDRAADYDDWTMNGDILLYFPPLDAALEISSMGVRMDADSPCAASAKRGEPKHGWHCPITAPFWTANCP